MTLTAPFWPHAGAVLNPEASAPEAPSAWAADLAGRPPLQEPAFPRRSHRVLDRPGGPRPSARLVRVWALPLDMARDIRISPPPAASRL